MRNSGWEGREECAAAPTPLRRGYEANSAAVILLSRVIALFGRELVVMTVSALEIIP